MEDKNITETMPESWEFNKEVAEVFDEMLARSIPNYFQMKSAYITLCLNHVKRISGPKRILDLGCGTLTSSLELYEKLDNCTLIGIDKSHPMINKARQIARYREGIQLIEKDITQFDLTEYSNIDIVLSIFTLQFIPTEERFKILSQTYKSQKEGGVIIFIEKVIHNNPQIETLYQNTYYSIKEQNGYSRTENENKKQKLTRQLIPVSDQFNLDLLKQVGYKYGTIFWKTMNFTGYIAFK